MIILGGTMLRDSFKNRGQDARTGAGRTEGHTPLAEAAQSPESGYRDAPGSPFFSWLRGTGTNLLNPKVGVFYIAMLPQFIPQHTSHLLMGVLLAGVHDVEALAWFSFLIIASGFARTWLRSSRAQRALDRVTGVVLIGFGLRLALSEH